MEKKEIRTLFTETMFTNLCKTGYVTQYSTLSGNNDIRFTRRDIVDLSKGQIVEKSELDDLLLKYALQDIGLDLIREIIKRSPIYSEVLSEI